MRNMIGAYIFLNPSSNATAHVYPTLNIIRVEASKTIHTFWPLKKDIAYY